jgi:hypothetical protein
MAMDGVGLLVNRLHIPISLLDERTCGFDRPNHCSHGMHPLCLAGWLRVANRSHDQAKNIPFEPIGIIHQT